MCSRTSSHSSFYVSSCLATPCFFFFNDTATTEIYTLSLHDALPICALRPRVDGERGHCVQKKRLDVVARSEEHTSELQSQSNLVCRLLLEKKKEHRGFEYSTDTRG